MPYAIMVFVIALGIGGYWLHSSGDESGYDRANKEAALRLLITQNEEARLRSEITEREAKARTKHMRAADNAKNEREILNGLLIDIHIAGLYIEPDIGYQGCRTEENPDTQIEGSTTTRIRLPDQIENDLSEMTIDAQLVVIQYNELREIVKNISCIEIVE